MNRPTRAPAPPQDYPEMDPVMDHPDIIDAPQHSLGSVVHSPVNNPPMPAARDKVSLPVTGSAHLAAAIAAVMAEIKPVEKSGWNDFHKYKYAKMQDLIGELTPLMGKHGIVVFQNELDRAMFDDNKVVSVRYEFTIAHSSGEVWPERPLMTGMSRCRDNKGGFDDKSFNKCHTAARKYFLISLFQIPTEDEDDADRGGPPQQRPQQQQQRPTAPAPAPDGKVRPHMIQVIEGEDPRGWADRFVKAIQGATSAEVDMWYDANAKVFDKLKLRFAELHDELLDIMDGIAGDKSDPISSGPAPAPAPQQAKPRAPAPDTKPTGSNELWLESLRNVFSGCESVAALQEAQNTYMMNKRGKVSDADWQAAINIAKSELERIQQPR